MNRPQIKYKVEKKKKRWLVLAGEVEIAGGKRGWGGGGIVVAKGGEGVGGARVTRWGYNCVVVFSLIIYKRDYGRIFDIRNKVNSFEM